MVHLSSMMVAVTAMVLGINALDDNSANKLREELKAANIIPDAFENVNPLTEMKIIYNNKEVKNGDKVLPSEAANRPGIQFSAPDKKKQYTVVMEDLDTPAPHVRHWIATNIKGADAENVIKDPSKMQEYVPYKGPTPPDNGFHRYLFALYEQSQENQKMTPELKDPTNHRAFFDVNKFAEENKLKLVAATYMNSEHQEGFESTYSKTDKRSLARRAVSMKKGYVPNNHHVRRDNLPELETQNSPLQEQAINYGDGYSPSAGITGQYGGTWNSGQSFSSGYGQPSNGGQGGYDSGAGIIIDADGPSSGGSFDPTTGKWFYNSNSGSPSGSSGNWDYNAVRPGNPPTDNWNYYGNGGNLGGSIPPGPGNGGYYYNNGNWYYSGSGGSTGTSVTGSNGYYNGNEQYYTGGGSGSFNGNIGGTGTFNPNGNGGIIAGGGSGSFNGNIGGTGTFNPNGNGGIIVAGGGSGSFNGNIGGTGTFNPNGNGGIIAGGGGSGSFNGNIGGTGTFNPNGNGGIIVAGGSGSFNGNTGGTGTFNPNGNGGIIVAGGSGSFNGNTGGSGTFNPNGNGGIIVAGGSGNGGIVVHGNPIDPIPTPIATPSTPTPSAHTSYYTYYYTISNVNFQPGQTYRGSDGTLYRIPLATSTPVPNLYRRDENEVEKPEEEDDREVIKLDENSGLDKSDIKLYNGIQDAIRAMDDAADDLNELVADIYLGPDEVASAN